MDDDCPSRFVLLFGYIFWGSIATVIYGLLLAGKPYTEIPASTWIICTLPFLLHISCQISIILFRYEDSDDIKMLSIDFFLMLITTSLLFFILSLFPSAANEHWRLRSLWERILNFDILPMTIEKGIVGGIIFLPGPGFILVLLLRALFEKENVSKKSGTFKKLQLNNEKQMNSIDKKKFGQELRDVYTNPEMMAPLQILKSLRDLERFVRFLQKMKDQNVYWARADAAMKAFIDHSSLKELPGLGDRLLYTGLDKLQWYVEQMTQVDN